MDIVSHGIWAALTAKSANQKLDKSKNRKFLKARWFIFWGIFPDLLGFTIFFAWLFGGLIFGSLDFSNLPSPETFEPAGSDTSWILRLTSLNYNLGHSFFVFFAIFALLALIRRRLVWEISGWFLHIIIDIPTHSYAFYPTPFLWPVSDWKVNGFSWANPWFMVFNYFLITVVYLLLTKSRK